MYCPACGTPDQLGRYCSSCGIPISAAAPYPEVVDPSAADPHSTPAPEALARSTPPPTEDDDPGWHRSRSKLGVAIGFFLLSAFVLAHSLALNRLQPGQSASGSAMAAGFLVALGAFPAIVGLVRFFFRWSRGYRYRLINRSVLSGWTFAVAAVLNFIDSTGYHH